MSQTKRKENIETKTVVAHAIHSKCNHPKRKKAEMSPCATCHNECLNLSAYRYPCERWNSWFDREKPDKKLAKEVSPRKPETKTSAELNPLGFDQECRGCWEKESECPKCSWNTERWVSEAEYAELQLDRDRQSSKLAKMALRFDKAECTIADLREGLEEKDKQIKGLEVALNDPRPYLNKKIAVLEGENAKIKTEVQLWKDRFGVAIEKGAKLEERLEAIRLKIKDSAFEITVADPEEHRRMKDAKEQFFTYPMKVIKVVEVERLGVLVSPKELDQKTGED